MKTYRLWIATACLALSTGCNGESKDTKSKKSVKAATTSQQVGLNAEATVPSLEQLISDLKSQRNQQKKYEAMEALEKHYLDSANLKPVLKTIDAVALPTRVAFYSRLIKESPHEEIQAVAKALFFKANGPFLDESKRYGVEIEEKYSDIQFGEGTLGDIKPSFAVMHLGVGKQAGEITAPDMDDREFNLSDYRGKIVMLDFWGNW